MTNNLNICVLCGQNLKNVTDEDKLEFKDTTVLYSCPTCKLIYDDSIHAYYKNGNSIEAKNLQAIRTFFKEEMDDNIKVLTIDNMDKIISEVKYRMGEFNIFNNTPKEIYE
ncbi:MAG: hypothetical protein WCK67_00880 [bacterium]